MICGAALCILLSKFASATIQAAFPLNNQVPPVAHISQYYVYQFASNTFTTTTGHDLVYSIRQAPAWLELDNASHTLRGIPAIADVGSVTFALSATDGLDFADSQVSLMVVKDAAPSLSGNVSAVLAAAGTLSGPTTLALGPGAFFTIRIGREFFQGSDPIFLYATSADRSPLPSWVSFDPATAIFTGSAPQPAAASRVYGISLFASHVAGFAEVDISFAINVANHKLLFASVGIGVTVSSVADVSIDIGAFLTLDGLPAPVESIANTSLEGPGWLTFDSSTLLLSGSPPEGRPSEEVTVSVRDIYGDDASMAIQLAFVLSVTNSTPARKTQMSTASATSLTSGLISTDTGRPHQTSVSNSSWTDPGLGEMGYNHGGSLSQGDIAAIVVPPVLIFVGLLSLSIVLAIHRKRRHLEQSSEVDGNVLSRGADNNANQEPQRRGFRNSWLPPISMGIGADPDHSWPELSEGSFASVPDGQANAIGGAHKETSHDLAHTFNHSSYSVGHSYRDLSDLVEATPGAPSRRRRSRPRKSSLLAADWATTASQVGPVLPGAGHGRAMTGSAGSGHMFSSSNRTSAASDNYGFLAAKQGTNYVGIGRGSTAREAARKSAMRSQRMSTIRKVSSPANDDATRPAERAFRDLRQSFISRRASNPHRPLFSAGTAVLRDPTVPDGRKSGGILGSIVPAGQQADHIFQDGYPGAASQHSSSAWNDVDSDSRYTLDEIEAETDQVAALHERNPLSTRLLTVAGKKEATVTSDEPCSVAGNSAFV